MNHLSPHLLHADILNMACDPMDCMNTMCYEKFIWDEEDIIKCRHLMEGYEVNEETFRFEEIKKKESYRQLSWQNIAHLSEGIL